MYIFISISQSSYVCSTIGPAGLHLENLPRGGGAKIGFQKWAMHSATLMHSRLCHLLYNHVICIVGVSRGVSSVKGGQDFVKGGGHPSPPLNEALRGL